MRSVEGKMMLQHPVDRVAPDIELKSLKRKQRKRR